MDLRHQSGHPQRVNYGWAIYEQVGYSIVNDGGLLKWEVPTDLTPEERAALEAWIKEINDKAAEVDQ